MNERQRRAIELMRENPRSRDLYQAGDYKSNCISSTGDCHNVPVLTNAEADELLSAGLIEPRWRDAAHLRYWCLKGYQT